MIFFNVLGIFMEFGMVVFVEFYLILLILIGFKIIDVYDILYDYVFFNGVYKCRF